VLESLKWRFEFIEGEGAVMVVVMAPSRSSLLEEGEEVLSVVEEE
jgi:hypothetical protein